jgi:hypothetical protein
VGGVEDDRGDREVADVRYSGPKIAEAESVGEEHETELRAVRERCATVRKNER